MNKIVYKNETVTIQGTSEQNMIFCFILGNSDADRTALDHSGLQSDPLTNKVPDHPPKTGLGQVRQARTDLRPHKLPELVFFGAQILVRVCNSTACCMNTYISGPRTRL